MEIVSCAEELDLLPYGIQPGKCVDDEYIARTFGLRLDGEEGSDPTQSVRLRGEQGYWHVRLMPVWLPVLLCDEQLRARKTES